MLLQQQIADLDFDTYFDVTSNITQQQQQQQLMYSNQNAQQHQQSIYPTQQVDISRFPHNQQYFMPQQQQQHTQPQSTLSIFDWCFKQQQQQAQTPATTPGIASPDPKNRPDYFYSVQPSNPAAPPVDDMSPQFDISQHESSVIVKTEPVNYEFNDGSNPLMYNVSSENTVSTKLVNSNNSTTGLPTPTSDMTFPTTPQSRHSESTPSSPINSSKDVSSSTKNSPPLENAFAAIDQWGKNIDKAAPTNCTTKEEDFYDTRNWRKTLRSDSTTSNTSDMVTAAVAAVAARSRAPIETGRQLKKVAHNAIERRYRNNINDRIRDLKNVVPALYKAKIREKKNSNNNNKSSSNEDDDDSSDEEVEGSPNSEENNNQAGEIVDGVEVAKKLNKATILHKATEYIHHLKHTNELARRENQVLQQILAQMPGGKKVLARFQMQKMDFEQAEQQRLLAERKQSLERERFERQRMLRERAAQRAALAELLPKPERRHYRRRGRKQQQQQQQQVDKASPPISTSSSTAVSSPAGSPVPEERSKDFLLINHAKCDAASPPASPNY